MTAERKKIAVLLLSATLCCSSAGAVTPADFPALSETASGVGVEKNAYDFEADGVYYNITSRQDRTVEVTCLYRMHDKNCLAYEGKIVIPQKVTRDGYDYTVTGIGEYAFYACENLLSVTLPPTITSIGNFAFRECANLRAVKIGVGSRLKRIGDESFRLCANLHSLVIPDSVETIGGYAFSGCTKLQKMTVPNSVKTIGTCAFYTCSDMTEITIGASVTSMGRYCFYWCKSLEKVTVLAPVPPTCPKGGIISSKNAGKIALYVPSGCAGAYTGAEIWKDFGSVRESESESE